MVILANGSETIAKRIGSACSLPSLPLTSVFYIPGSSFNLISISKLTRDLIYLITFSDNPVTLQDRSTRQTIGIRCESQGLISAPLHLPLLALPWILLSLFTVILVIQTFSSFGKWFLVFLLCFQLSVSHVNLGNILVSHFQSA